MSDKRLLSEDELTAMKIMAWDEFSLRDQWKLWVHIDALQERVEAAEAEHQAFMDLFQVNFVLGTPPELEPEDIHEWFTRELKMSRAEFAKRATAEEKDES